MILEILLTPIFWVIVNLIYLVPAFSLPADFVTAMTSFFSLVSAVGFFIPLDTVGEILALYVTFYIFRMAFASLSYILQKIPFLNMK